MLQDNAMEYLLCWLGEQAAASEGALNQQAWEFPGAPVQLSLNSDEGGEQAAENVSHSRRDWEDGHSEIP